MSSMEAELALSSIDSILICLDRDGKITRWNAKSERIFGIPSSAVLGLPLHECGVAWSTDAVKDIFEKCSRSRKTENPGDLRYRRRDGSEGILGFRVIPLSLSNGEVLSFLWYGADVTDRRIQDSHLQQAQKMESIGRLAAGVAHEINTPIQYVGDNTKFLLDSFGSLCQLLKRYDELLQAARAGSVSVELIAAIEDASQDADSEYLVEEIPKALHQSLEGIDRVADIVRAMKEFSHPGDDEKKACDLNRAIQSTVTVSRNEWKYVAEVVTQLDPDLPLVPCLLGGFNQTILNMIVNAAHAIEDVVAGHEGQKGTITISTRQIESWAEIRITDTGTGIPEAVRSNVFDPFFTTKPLGKGTGQGLTMAHSFIKKKLEGTLSFETETGHGTTFVIRLPLEPTAN